MRQSLRCHMCSKEATKVGYPAWVTSRYDNYIFEIGCCDEHYPQTKDLICELRKAFEVKHDNF